jgi:hypothetical protein
LYWFNIMSSIKYTIRDILWCLLVAGLVLGWWRSHLNAMSSNAQLQEKLDLATLEQERLAWREESLLRYLSKQKIKVQFFDRPPVKHRSMKIIYLPDDE